MRGAIAGLAFTLLVTGTSNGADLVLPAPDPEQLQLSVPLDLTRPPDTGTTSRPRTSPNLGPAADFQSGSSALFREVPSITGRYSVGGTTLLPFVAAGFNGGYTERDRAMNPTTAPSLSDQMGLRGQWSQFGPGMAPNEFQMGVRIPF